MKIFKPCKQTFITQAYGLLNTAPNLIPMYQELGLQGHNGFDFSAPLGTEIYYNASVRGTVWQVGVYADGCKYVKIITQAGDKYYQHRYLHIQEALVTPGEVLEGGEKIALADNTGKYTTGSHLHYDLSAMTLSGNSYNYLNPDNGYTGQIDPSPFYQPDFIGDIIEHQQEAISLLEQIINAIKKLFGK